MGGVRGEPFCYDISLSCRQEMIADYVFQNPEQLALL
jgi:hypothetical protein